jgi:DUF1680 family protein
MKLVRLVVICAAPIVIAASLAAAPAKTTAVVGGDRDARQDSGATVAVNKYYPANRPPLQRAAYVRLPFGAVRPSGWLARQTQIQVDGITGHFDQFFKYENIDIDSVHGATRPRWEYADLSLGWVTQDAALMVEARRMLDSRLSDATPHPTLDYKTSRGAQDVVKLLIRYYEVTGDKRVLDYFNRYYAPILKADRGSADPWDRFSRRGGDDGSVQAENNIGLYWMYNQTGDKRYLEASGYFDGVVETVRRYFTDFPVVRPGDPASPFLTWEEFSHNRRVPRGTDVDWLWSVHGLCISWGILDPAVYYQLHPDERYRTAVFKGIENLDKYYGQVGGRYAAHENLPTLERGRKPTNGTELCDVIEYTEAMFRFFEIFGETSVADRAEVLTYNSIPGATTPDFWCHQYSSAANQISSTVADRGWDNQPDANTYGFTPNFPCCLWRSHRAWPNFISQMWMATHDNGLVAVAYGPSQVTAKVADGSEVTISEETEYPFDGKVLFRIKLAKPAVFPLKLRIPGWAKQGTVRYGNESWTPPGGQIIALQRAWKNGDVVSLELPMEIRTERRYNNAASVLRGPLYFALRVGQQYKGGGMPRNVVITPTTAWNYGLVFPNGESIGESKVVRNPIGSYPFAQKDEPVLVKEAAAGELPLDKKWREIRYQGDAPVVIHTRARLLPQWGTAEDYPANAADPPKSPVRASGPDVPVELIPYGCTRLRISEFPVVIE